MIEFEEDYMAGMVGLTKDQQIERLKTENDTLRNMKDMPIGWQTQSGQQIKLLWAKCEERDKVILDLRVENSRLQSLEDCCKAFIKQNVIRETRDVFDSSWVATKSLSFIRGICEIVGYHKD